MEKQVQKCPLCGTKLKMKNGRMTCKDCGYYLRDGQSDSAASGSGAQTGGYQYNPAYSRPTASPNSYNPAGGSSRSGASKAKGEGGSSKSKFVPAFVSVLSAVAVGIVVGVLRYGLLDVLRDAFDKDDSPSISDELQNSWQSYSTKAPAAGTSAPAASSEARLPESDFFRFFIETVYGKGYRTITAQEYAAVTALELNRDDKAIYYQLNNGETQSIYYISDSGLKLSDLRCFPGLEVLSLDDDLRSGDLKGLNNLYAVSSENTFTDLAKIIPHPENITGLGVYDWTMTKTLSGIENFPNLLYLRVDYSSLADISALNDYSNLQSLVLMNCSNVTDFSPLMAMTGLQDLSIQSAQLKTIDFVKKMPGLLSFSVSGKSKYGTNGGKLQSIDALSSCPDLVSLSVTDQPSITDYSVISGLTDLSYLELGLSSNAALPSLKDLTALESLSLKGVRDLSPLRDAPGVISLSMERCTSHDLDAITVMQELTHLRIKDFSNLTESLTPLTQLPNLLYLDLSGTKVFGNVEEIFQIPSLKYLYLDDCQIGIDFAAFPLDTDLELLSMDNTRILKDPSHNNGDKVDLNEHPEFFESFPELIELYLNSSGLNSIDFVEDIPNLQYLDISNTYVSNLTPLLQLKDFHAVWHNNTTILENLPADSEIRVLTESRD